MVDSVLEVKQIKQLSADGGATVVDVENQTIDDVTIGGTTPAAGTFTTFTSTGITDGASSTAVTIDASGKVGIGTTSPAKTLDVRGSSYPEIRFSSTDSTNPNIFFGDETDLVKVGIGLDNSSNALVFIGYNNNERMRIDSSGNVLIGKTSRDFNVAGIDLSVQSDLHFVKAGTVCSFNRLSSDGVIINLAQAGTIEGSISVSGTTVSLNGGHLARWAQLPDSSKDESIVKGTVMTNLNEMSEWSHPDEYWTEEDELPVDEEGNPTAAVGDLKKAAFTEDNEQLNRMVVSSVEGDPNVAGVFVNWDNDDDKFNDMNIAMTGDMVIRIAQNVVVNRGDLLVSAGDGTAKPQEDDIVRSKTIAKVTSTHVSKTYPDGSYLVPCVLMAC